MLIFKPKFLDTRLTHIGNVTVDTFFKAVLIALFFTTILWASIFLYVAFYYTYVPSIEHVKSVNLQFTPCDGEEKDYGRGVCSFLKAHVELTKADHLFMLGQPYKITLFLEVPESEPNKSLGMFMVCGQLMDKKGVTVTMVCRSAMLKYKSPLVHTLTTLALAPMYVFNYLEEKQTIEVELYTNFEDDQNYPVTDMVIELKSPQVEVYNSRLQIDAHLSGLRYLMYNWPTVSAVLGSTFNMIVILFIAVLSWLHLTKSDVMAGRQLLYKKFKDKLSPVFKAKKQISTIGDQPERLVSIPDKPERLVFDLKLEPESSDA